MLDGMNQNYAINNLSIFDNYKFSNSHQFRGESLILRLTTFANK